MTARPPLPRHLFTLDWLGGTEELHDESCRHCMRTAKALCDTARKYNMGQASWHAPVHGARIKRVTRTDRLHGLRVG